MNPAWYDIAVGEIGVREVAGSKHNPRILEYHAQTGLAATTDEVPWCGSFVAWTLYRAGIDYQSVWATAAGARQWLKFGRELTGNRVTPGAIVVLRRGQPPSGHVGIFAGWVDKERTKLRVLGGNQSNMVSIAVYPATQVLGFRWPKNVPLPVVAQPLKTSGVLWGTGGVAGVAITEVAVQAGPEVVRAINEADSQLSQGTVLSIVAAALILGLAAFVIVSRVRGSIAERKLGEGPVNGQAD
jgi:uncharacterized protein (TIGR02594 family)